MTNRTTTFTGLSTVAIPVTDQDKTKALLEGLGFETRFDADLGDGFRWIELVPPGAVTSIALVATGDGLPTGVDTGIRLVTPDARAAHAELLALGLSGRRAPRLAHRAADVHLLRPGRQPPLRGRAVLSRDPASHVERPEHRSPRLPPAVRSGAMSGATPVSELDLPVWDTDTEVRGPRFHEVLGTLARQGWLARNELGYVVLGREAVVEVLRDRRLAFPALELLALQGITEGPAHERTRNGLMARTGEDHARLRRAVSPSLTAKAVDRLRPQLRDELGRLWAGVAEAGECEFVEAFANRLPSTAIAVLLGLPGEADRLARWSVALQGIFSFDPERWADTERAYLEVYGYVAELVERRHAEPGDDLVSTLAALALSGELTTAECISLVCSVIAGGTDTTAAQLGHGMRLFVEHPEQWELLAEHPELATRAAEEVLRFEPITPFTARLATEPFEHRGVEFPTGSVLFACTATANRDAATFIDPDRFDIAVDRGSGAQALTFGFGAHFCLGAALARAELAETFSALAARMAEPHLVGEAVYGPTGGIYAMASVPIGFTPRDPDVRCPPASPR